MENNKLNGTGFWQKLPQSAIELIEKSAKPLEFKRGDFVYHAGGDPKGMYVVRSGLVGLAAISQKGSEHLLRLFKPGQFFGHRSLFANEKYHANAVCLEKTELGFIEEKVVFEVLTTFPETQRILIETLAVELGQAEMQRVRIADQDVLSRIAAAILYLKELYPDHTWTRVEIANFVASTGPTVIRGLAELERRGLIHQEARRIEVLNKDGLLNLTD